MDRGNAFAVLGITALAVLACTGEAPQLATTDDLAETAGPTSPGCVANVQESVDSLQAVGEAFDFELDGASDPTKSRHWQGIQRLDQGQRSYLIISRNGIPCSNERGCGGFVVVQLGAGDNRNTGDLGKRVVLEFAIEEPAFDHAGGFQMIGGLLAIGLEHRDLLSKVFLYDLSDPLSPRRIGASPERTNQGAGAVGVASQPDGHLLLAVGGWDSDRIDFYRSTGALLNSADLKFTLEDTWTKDELEIPVGRNALAYQSVNFVRQCNGSQFLVAAGRTEAEPEQPQDRVDLFRLAGDAQHRELRWITSRVLSCTALGTEVCNLRAAAGVYLDPAGRLLLYAAEHENTGEPEGKGSLGNAPKKVQVRAFGPPAGLTPE